MDIVVLAGGLSTERDVSFVTGNMVSKALRKNGHRVILLDVFMGYSDKKEDISDIFEHTEEVSVQIEEIPTVRWIKTLQNSSLWQTVFRHRVESG